MRRTARGFSLVETVLALGIFAFCVLVIAGLLISGINAARSVANETNAVSLANSIFGAWQVQANKAAQLSITNMVTNLPALRDAPIVGDQNVYFFDASGVQVAEDNAAAASLKMLYSVQWLDSEDPEEPSSMAEVILDFYWPAQADENVAQQRRFRRMFYLEDI
jgi:uncharacterized protein (TIGR02598 family)